jgi:predicted amidohydrolase
MRIAYYQFHPQFGKRETNIEKCVDRLQSLEVDLVVLPELFSSGYQFVSISEVLALAEDSKEGPTLAAMTELARKKEFFIVGGFAEKEGGKIYNSAFLVGPEGLVDIYRKSHLFSEEKQWFSPGNTPYRTHDIGPARIGIMICFDWIFPEVARSLALLGADIICHPANLVLPHCPQATITRSLENRVFIILANRIGCEERGGKKPLTFIGQSRVVDPTGKVLVGSSQETEEVQIVEIDPQIARNKTIAGVNDLFTDRRKEFFYSLTESG